MNYAALQCAEVYNKRCRFQGVPTVSHKMLELKALAGPRVEPACLNLYGMPHDVHVYSGDV